MKYSKKVSLVLLSSLTLSLAVNVYPSALAEDYDREGVVEMFEQGITEQYNYEEADEFISNIESAYEEQGDAIFRGDWLDDTKVNAPMHGDFSRGQMLHLREYLNRSRSGQGNSAVQENSDDDYDYGHHHGGHHYGGMHHGGHHGMHRSRINHHRGHRYHNGMYQFRPCGSLTHEEDGYDAPGTLGYVIPFDMMTEKATFKHSDSAPAVALDIPNNQIQIDDQTYTIETDYIDNKTIKIHSHSNYDETRDIVVNSRITLIDGPEDYLDMTFYLFENRDGKLALATYDFLQKDGEDSSSMLEYVLEDLGNN